MPQHQRPLSRRRFLGLAGLGVLTIPWLSSWAPRVRAFPIAQVGLRPLRVGVLLPQTSSYPALGENLLAGMSLYDELAGDRGLDVISAPVGVGAGDCLGAAERLVAAERVDLLVGAMHAGVARQLRPLLEARRIPLLVSEVGANAVDPTEASPYIWHHTLGYWQAQWAMGAWAARNLGRRAILAASLRDSGYDTLYAFQLGLESAGGELIQTRITHLRPTDNGLTALLDEIRENKPDFVYGLYCGLPAVDFITAYAASGLATKIPLAGGAFMVEGHLLPTLGKAALGIRSALAWAADRDSAEARTLERAYRARANCPADPFAALGYDTARLILSARQQGGSLAEALGAARFASARGPLQMDPSTQQARTPLYLREVRARSGTLANVVVGELEAPADLPARFAAARSGPRTGWLNAYLSL